MSRPRPVSGGPLDLAAPETDAGRFSTSEDARYERGGALGRGGMGSVDLVFDRRLERDVARKTTLRHDGDSTGALIREATLTARLEHPNIVPIHGAGVTEDGRPYYTMPVLRGRSLADAVDEASGPEDRRRLVRHVLDATQAMAYAHSRGVLHRDIKPENILVGSFGQTQVTDWGLACPIAEAGPQTGPALGTPGFMAPEQRRGDRLDRRADVYSLGAVLRDVVGDDGPPELAAIARRACADQLDARYPSADALAEDLSAWFEGRQVAAHEYSAREILVRFVQAWRAPLLVASVGVIGVVAALTLGFVRTASERDRARAAEREAEQNLGRALLAQAIVAADNRDRERAEILAAHALTRHESPDARGVLARFGGRPRLEPRVRRPLPGCDVHRMSLDGTQFACARDGRVTRTNLRDWTTETIDLDASDLAFAGTSMLIASEPAGLLEWALDASAPTTLSDRQIGAALMPDSLDVASIAVELRGPIGMRRGDTIALVGHACGTHTNVVALASDPDGSALVACGDHRVVRARVVAGEPVFTVELRLPDEEGVADSLSVDADGRIAVGTLRGHVHVYDGRRAVESAELPELFHAASWPSGIYRVLLDGDRVAALSVSGILRVWDLRTGLLIGQTRPGPASFAFVGDSLRVAGSELVDLTVPTSLRPERIAFDEGVSDVAVHPDGTLAAASLGNGKIAVVDLARGTTVQTLHWQDSVAKAVAFSPDGEWLATGVASGPQRVYRIDDWSHVEIGERGFRRLTWVGDTLIGSTYAPEVIRWTPDGGEVSVELGVSLLELEAWDGTIVATDNNKDTWIGLSPEALERGPDVVRPISVIPVDGGMVVGAAQTLTRYRGSDVVWTRPSRALVCDLARSTTGLLAVALINGDVEIRDLDGQLLANLPGHTQRAATVAFSPDGAWLVSGGWDLSLRTWSMADLRRDPAALVRELEATWRTSLESALAER